MVMTQGWFVYCYTQKIWKVWVTGWSKLYHCLSPLTFSDWNDFGIVVRLVVLRIRFRQSQVPSTFFASKCWSWSTKPSKGFQRSHFAECKQKKRDLSIDAQTDIASGKPWHNYGLRSTMFNGKTHWFDSAIFQFANCYKSTEGNIEILQKSNRNLEIP